MAGSIEAWMHRYIQVGVDQCGVDACSVTTRVFREGDAEPADEPKEDDEGHPGHGPGKPVTAEELAPFPA
eukprot:3226802-Lingulodinium_polyedra.AAC.1